MQINPAAPFSMNFMAPSVAPTYDEIRAGKDMLKYQKAPVEVSTYDVDVFDMSSADDRKRYCELMLKVAKLVQAQQAVIWRNDLQVLQKKDGTGWFRYLEWSRYALSKEAEQISKNEDRLRKESSEQFDELRKKAVEGAKQAMSEIIGQPLRPSDGVPASENRQKKFVPPKPKRNVGKVHDVGSDEVSDEDFFDEMTAWGDKYKELPPQFQPKDAMPGVKAVYA